MLGFSVQPRLSPRQSIVITPQLQQAINLLQMNNVDLCDHAEEVSEGNPFLEVTRPARADITVSAGLLRGGSLVRGPAVDGDMAARLVDESYDSLYRTVFRQIDLLFDNARDRAIAFGICDHLEPTGWMIEPLEHIAVRLGCSEGDVAGVLKTLQKMEPTGLFARDLAECLRLQAQEAGLLDEYMAKLIEHLPLLAKGDFAALSRAIDCTPHELAARVRHLRGFNPKPGLRFEDTTSCKPGEPDLLARRTEDGTWTITVNRSTLPELRIDDAYGRKVRKLVADNPEHAAFLRDAMNSANWLKRAIAQRNETAQKIGAEIVRYQQAFLEKGIRHLRPLQLRVVADAVGVHESTVSRVTSSMMMQTPQGTFPLRAFFSSALGADEKEEGQAASAIRDRIKEMIAGEPADAPLSDETIAKTLQAEGIMIARRTVAKYRELDGIAGSSHRRRSRRMAELLDC